ncbi:MAG: outer membrane protein [Psychroserpens sp.]|jgi:outer membrane protein
MAFKLLLISLVIICTSASAEYTLNEKTENIRDGAYLDIGLGARYKSDPFIYDEDKNGSGLALYVNGRYQKYGLFVEFPRGTSKQQTTVISIGYNFLNTKNWSYDLQVAMNHPQLEHELPESKLLRERISHSKLGLRILGDFDNTHFKLIAAGSSGGDGLYASAWLSHNYQIYNWNLYISAGIEYRNKDVVNYFYAINEVEGLPYYRGESGYEYTGQIGFDYPIDVDWVFEGYIRATHLPTGISDSPLVDGDSITEGGVLIKYVF